MSTVLISQENRQTKKKSKNKKEPNKQNSCSLNFFAYILYLEVNETRKCSLSCDYKTAKLHEQGYQVLGIISIIADLICKSEMHC